MFRDTFEELYIDIVWEFAERFGKDAGQIFYESDLLLEDAGDETIKKFLDEMGHPASEDNIRFLKNYINACDKFEEVCELLAGALGKTLYEYKHQEEIANEIWKARQEKQSEELQGDIQ